MRAGVDEELVDLFVRLAGIASPTGAEREVADAVKEYLGDLGLGVHEDGSAPVTGCGCGNLVARIPGRGQAETIGLCAHLDTVPVSGAPRVVVADGVVCSDGATVLGADDKAAVAVLLTLARALVADPPAGDVELVLTAGEEAGLLGAKALDLAGLTARRVFVLDSDGAPGTLIVASPTQKRVDLEFRGQAAHAGIAPELGRNAIVAAANAVAAMRLGRIDDETTANIGVVRGGTARNVVAERCAVSGEVRSHDPAKVTALAEEMVHAAAAAAAAAGVDVEIDVREAFRGYRHPADSPLLAIGVRAAAHAGLEARLVDGGGGSDANVFNAAGLPALTLGVGFENAHSPQECMSLERLAELADMAARRGARRRVGRVAARGGVTGHRSSAGKRAAAGGPAAHGKGSGGPQGPPPDPLVAEFLDYVRYERGLSPNTVVAYGRDLAAFTAFLAAAGTQPGRAAADDVRAYFAGTGGDGAPSSVARRTAAVRAFYAYLVREGVREDDPSALLRTPKRPQELPRVLSVEEVEAILATVVPAGPLGQRDLAALELLYGCGLRVSELVGLRDGDVDVEGGHRALHRQGRQGAGRAHGRRGRRRREPVRGRRAAGAAARPPPPGAHPERPRRPADAPGLRLHPPARARARRHAGRRQRAHVPALVRHAPAGRGRRPAQRAGDARPRQRGDHPVVHSRDRRAPARGVPGDAPARPAAARSGGGLMPVVPRSARSAIERPPARRAPRGTDE